MEVKVGAKGRRGRRWRRIRPWKVVGRVESSTRVSDGPSTEQNREKRATRELERKRGVEQTVCSLDRIIAGGSELTLPRLASPRRESPRPHLPSYLFPFSPPFVQLPLLVFRSFRATLTFLSIFFSPVNLLPWSLKGISIARTRRWAKLRSVLRKFASICPRFNEIVRASERGWSYVVY